MALSVIIPTFNEESYLPGTLSSLQKAISVCTCGVEVIVVDNASADRTAEIARSFGATVAYEPVHNIARVRNTGATLAHGDVLIFLDADTPVPSHFLRTVAEAVEDPACIGGRPDVVHTPKSRVLRAYFSAWRWFGTKLGMAQGAGQFCRKTAFNALDGYDQSYFMGEDVDFYWRLQRLCMKSGGYLKFLDDVRLFPSPRRFDHTPIWRTLIWTNPLCLAPFRKSKSVWAEWYVRPPR